MLTKFWYDQPVRTQLLVAVATINILAAVIAGMVAILNTRTATKVEMDAWLEIAHRYVDLKLKELSSQGKLDQLDEELPPQLRQLRHVRIMFMDKSGRLAIISPEGESNGVAQADAPDWFVTLVQPEVSQRSVRVLPDGEHPIIILGEPADEIAEAWQDFSSLALIWIGINVVVLVVLYLVLGRVLDPLASLSKGMHRLEDGEYGARLKPSKVQELAVITNRFNTLASALDVARKENERLYRELINVQEAERREIANELHDEAGACLFGIAANASSIQTTAGQLTGQGASKISNRAGEILSIAERLKAQNRALLKKLRPGPLGQVKLSDLITELTAGLQGRHPETQIRTDIGELAKSYGEPVDLAIYRCIQEAITNAIRHGHAANVSVDLVEKKRALGANGHNGADVELVVADDGQGMAPSTSKGFGLTTMTERVRSVGGDCVVESEPMNGTTVKVGIPVNKISKTRAGAPGLVGELS